ncbi:GNAT family N-acetyltransferase [Streptomyces sp. NPDC058657]|uniref:GNAT family N-acetyltransferase n=1 Tax=unclassified Streptomyces TaxID=2593676 RepID=UPI003664DCB5
MSTPPSAALSSAAPASAGAPAPSRTPAPACTPASAGTSAPGTPAFAGASAADYAPAPQDFVRTTLVLDEQVVLRPWSREDLGTPTTLEGLVTAATDPQTAMWNPFPATDLAAAKKWIEYRADGWANGNVATFALEDNAGCPGAEDVAPGLLGALTVRWTDRTQGVAMIGYWLLPLARGRGLAARATTAAADWAFRTAGVRRIGLAHAVENSASCRVARRCGFTLEGVLRASYRFGDGRYHDEHLHARLATDPPAAAHD